MRTTLIPRPLTRLALSLAALVLTSGPAVPADAPPGFTETVSVAARELTVYNLIGEVRLEPHAGSGFEVIVKAGGRDANRDSLKLDVKEESGSGSRVTVVFPVDSQTSYVYPALGRGSSTTFNLDGKHRKQNDGWMAALGSFFSGWSGAEIKVRGSGSGAEMWADLVVRVPRGATLNVEHGVGKLLANGVDGELHLQAHSGSVTVTDCRGARLEIATGSGEIKVEGVAVDALELATGSGSVDALALKVGSADVGTGSGSVDLSLESTGSGAIEVATGSGGIRIALPESAAAHVEAATGSGGISVEGFEGAKVRRDSDHELEVEIGGGGGPRVELATGSGSITIRSRR